MMDIQPIEHLPFEPLLGFSSPHAQTVLGCFCPAGTPPPAIPIIVQLTDGDQLCCELSTPKNWIATQKTVILVHGLGGSHKSPYMIRFSRKLYQNGYQVLRVNMRGCGSGHQLASRPYHGGVSSDIQNVVETIKKKFPLSPIVLVGFSLGGNIVLKLAGELGAGANKLIESTIAVCPPVDLAQCSALLARPLNKLYNQYYMRHLEKQAERWINGRPFSNLYEFDCLITAPHWGFQGAFDYYQQCSSRFILPQIQHPCRILFSADDPFIDYRSCLELPLPIHVKVSVSPYGGHLGFLGWSGRQHFYFWMDNLLLKWIG